MADSLVAKPKVTLPVWEHLGFQPKKKGEPANLDEAISERVIHENTELKNERAVLLNDRLSFNELTW